MGRSNPWGWPMQPESLPVPHAPHTTVITLHLGPWSPSSPPTLLPFYHIETFHLGASPFSASLQIPPGFISSLVYSPWLRTSTSLSLSLPSTLTVLPSCPHIVSRGKAYAWTRPMSSLLSHSPCNRLPGTCQSEAQHVECPRPR